MRQSDIYEELYELYQLDTDFAECLDSHRRALRIAPGHIYEVIDKLIDELKSIDEDAVMGNASITALNFLYDRYK